MIELNYTNFVRTYLFGIDLRASNGEILTEAHINHFYNISLAEFERYFRYDLNKKVFKSINEAVSSERGTLEEVEDVNNPNKTYTDTVDRIPFEIDRYTSGVYPIQLFSKPVISVEEVRIYNVFNRLVNTYHSNNWTIRKDGSVIIRLINLKFLAIGGIAPLVDSPTVTPATDPTFIPDAIAVDYTAGFEDISYVPRDIIGFIEKLTAIACLNFIGDGLLAGFSSSTVSIDSISESLYTTQSATSAYFGARIKEYSNEVRQFIKANQFNYGNFHLVTI